jgi:hypothetical protein
LAGIGKASGLAPAVFRTAAVFIPGQAFRHKDKFLPPRGPEVLARRAAKIPTR